MSAKYFTLFFVFIINICNAANSDIKTLDGITYTNIKVISRNAYGIKVQHSGKLVKFIKYADMPDKLKKEYGYDEEKYRAYIQSIKKKLNKNSENKEESWVKINSSPAQNSHTDLMFWPDIKHLSIPKYRISGKYLFGTDALTAIEAFADKKKVSVEDVGCVGQIGSVSGLFHYRGTNNDKTLIATLLNKNYQSEGAVSNDMDSAAGLLGVPKTQVRAIGKLKGQKAFFYIDKKTRKLVAIIFEKNINNIKRAQNILTSFQQKTNFTAENIFLLGQSNGKIRMWRLPTVKK